MSAGSEDTGTPETDDVTELAVLAVIVYGVSVAVSLAIGAVVVAISEHTWSTS